MGLNIGLVGFESKNCAKVLEFYFSGCLFYAKLPKSKNILCLTKAYPRYPDGASDKNYIFLMIFSNTDKTDTQLNHPSTIYKYFSMVWKFISFHPLHFVQDKLEKEATRIFLIDLS